MIGDKLTGGNAMFKKLIVAADRGYVDDVHAAFDVPAHRSDAHDAVREDDGDARKGAR
jgi:hypothetical protein